MQGKDLPSMRIFSFYYHIFILMALIFSFSARAQEKRVAINNALTTDGDSLRFGKQEIRLFGIDAPEYRQNCRDKKDILWECGVKAHIFLKNLVEEGVIECQFRTKDRYGRWVARCFSSSGKDLAAELIKHGLAVAYLRYTHDYAALEKRARQEKRGIWRGDFQFPTVWRYEKYRKNGP